MYILQSNSITVEKSIRDPIYGFIEIPAELILLIDTSIFQRLRWVSQLPLEQLVYPSAQHTRFEHSIGVMHLAMNAAISLINSSAGMLQQAFSKDAEFASLGKKEAYKQFILSAGICGLLHDIGHAPFSHTLEEAVQYTRHDIAYDHEHVGFFLAKKLLQDKHLLQEVYAKKALKVLNKKLSITRRELQAIEIILRKLIDGPIDVDKGDYVLRDSYHCGVTYGVYDVQRLWKHIRIAEDYTISVDEKGALEAWSLRLARYKMHKNVYKHHVRNTTDALLVEILSDALDEIKTPGSAIWNTLLPFYERQGKLENNSDSIDFRYWTDSSLLKEIERMHKPYIHKKINKFLERDLHAYAFELSLSPYLEVANMFEREVKMKLKALRTTLFMEKGIEFSFLFNKRIVPPIFEEALQGYTPGEQDEGLSPACIKVIKDDGEVVPLAAYLDFALKTDQKTLIPSEEHVLWIFMNKADIIPHKSLVQREITNLLKEYRPV